MKNLSQAAELIKALRVAKDKTQAQFAAILGVTQPMISAWEGGSDQPSCEMFAKLGNLASYPDNIWFWQQVGLDPQEMFSAAEQILKERVKDRSALPDPKVVTEIGRFRLTAEGREEAGPALLIARERVPNPLSTVCLVLDEKNAGFSFSAGDLVVVDVFAGDVNTSEAFWNQLVLAEFGPRAEQAAGLQGIWPQGFSIGKLVLERNAQWTPKGVSFTGRLGPLIEAFDARSFPIGHYYHEVPPDLDRSPYLPPRDRDLARRIEKEAREEALKNFRPAKGCRILGRVIAWFPAPPEKK